MTCIVGIIDRKDKEVIIGADSAGCAGSHIRIRKDVKVFKKGKFLIGCTTSFRMIQILRFKLDVPDVGDKDLFEFMCTDFIDSVIKCFDDNGFGGRCSDRDLEGGVFIVGFRGRLFTVESDFQVSELTDDFCAVGCGEYYALGSLFSTNGADMNSQSRLNMALMSASFFSSGVSAPFNFVKCDF